MPDQSPATIIVIDDDPDHLQFVVTLLERAGYAVAGFRDAETALDIAERVAPALIVTDIFMPHIDGFEVLCRVKERVPVVAMSGKIDGHGTLYLESIRMLGAVAAFAKPIVGRDLVAAINAALRGPAFASG
jgi:DNA-binding response OmpR family regulator